MTRRTRHVLIVSGVATLLLVAAALVAWRFLGEERRMGRVVAGVLSSRTGLSVSVERAAADTSRLRLWGVRVPAGPGFPLDLRVAEIDVQGGVMPLLAPAGRRLSVTAVAATVTVTPQAGGALTAGAVDRLRDTLRTFLEWPGALTVRVEGGELRSQGHTYRLDATGDKTTDAVTLVMTLTPSGAAPALKVDARGTGGADGIVQVRLEVASQPGRLTGLWPSALPPPAALAARTDVQLVRGGELVVDGRLTVGDTQGIPAVVDFASRYDTGRGRLAVPRYVVGWGPEVHLEGEGALEPRGNDLTASATGRGTVDGSPVNGRAVYGLADGAIEGELTMETLEARRLARRLGLTPPTLEARAHSVTARFSGAVAGDRPTLSVDLLAQALTTPALAAFPVDGALKATLALAGGGAPRLAAISAATLTLTHDRHPVAVITSASRGRGLWPLTVDAKIDDLGRLAPALPFAATLQGTATLAGEATAADASSFRGTLKADVARAQFGPGGPLTATKVRATIPIDASAADNRSGSVSMERVAGYGLAITDVASRASLADGRLLLPDVHYLHYGGRGGGWVEIGVDGRAVPLRARLEGQDVSLADVVMESGTKIARVSGKVRYLATAQHALGTGFVALARMDSEEGGGEVSVDAIQRLLESGVVQAETSGVLRQTLENLRVFAYESLEGELRWSGGAGYMDLSLRGKKRLGIFPAPVEAINFRNVPLALLARTFGRESTP